MLLALKASYFVVEKSEILSKIETSYFLDADDFENENEEKTEKEFDETEKIHQIILITFVNTKSTTQKNDLDLHKDYRNLYFEFTTPPPEFS